MSAPPLSAGTQLHQIPSKPISGDWTICEVGNRWGAFRALAGPVYWTRIFDTYAEAAEFVRVAKARANITK